MDELYSPCEDKPAKIDLNVQPANHYTDSFYEIARLKKQVGKTNLSKHLNEKYNDAKIRKERLRKKLKEKLNQHTISFD
jgi:hypothetical protein